MTERTTRNPVLFQEIRRHFAGHETTITKMRKGLVINNSLVIRYIGRKGQNQRLEFTSLRDGHLSEDKRVELIEWFKNYRYFNPQDETEILIRFGRRPGRKDFVFLLETKNRIVPATYYGLNFESQPQEIKEIK